MPGHITIRNLTAQPLTLKVLERYSVPDQDDHSPNSGCSVSNITSKVTNLFYDGDAPHHVQVGEKKDVDVRMEPFTTHKTQILSAERELNETLRLIFRGDGGGRWRIDTPTPGPESIRLHALTPDPKHEYTAMYFEDSRFLALYEIPDLRCWMKYLLDSTSLSALIIPGTHNSSTHHKALPSVRCQAVSIREQLENGIRSFDIRVQPVDPEGPKQEELNLVHGAFPISLTGPKKFRHLVDDVLEYLEAFPSETVIMSIKREGTGNATDEQLSTILKDHYTNPQQWWTQPHLPTLGQARGKIILLRRFTLAEHLKHEWDGKGWGLNAENAPYNKPNSHYENFIGQDFCEVLEAKDIDKKIQYCFEHFERAGAAVTPLSGARPDGPLYLNVLSGANFWKHGCWPEKIAAKVNPAVTAYLCQKHEIG
ncbi:PLC-like phosphodiesterase, partial [Hortaea werneckii]